MTVERRNPGDKKLIASDWNQLADAYNSGMLGEPKQVGESTGMNAVKILVRNNTGADLGKRAIVGLGDSVISLTSNERQWKDEIVISGETPETGTHDTKYAVLLESIKDGKIGEAAVYGVTQVLLNVGNASHTHANIKDGETDYLETAASGTAEIIWKASGTGEKLGIVKLGKSPSTETSVSAPIKANMLVTVGDGSTVSQDWISNYHSPTKNTGYFVADIGSDYENGGMTILNESRPDINGIAYLPDAGIYEIDLYVQLYGTLSSPSYDYIDYIGTDLFFRGGATGSQGSPFDGTVNFHHTVTVHEEEQTCLVRRILKTSGGEYVNISMGQGNIGNAIKTTMQPTTNARHWLTIRKMATYSSSSF